jgi:hypothetical protein
MTPLLLTAALALAYPPAPPAEAKPTGTPPTFSVAKIDGERLTLTSTRIVTKYETRTATVQVGDRTEQRTVVVPVQVPEQAQTTYALKDVKAFDAANKPIEAAKLTERLKDPTAVVVSGDGQPVGEAFRKLLKDDAILLTVPQAQPVPPPDKAPPPPPPPPSKEEVRALPAVARAVARVDEKEKADEPKGKEVKAETHTGHFESNKSGLKGDASFLAFTDAKAFDAVFGKARTMGAKPNYVEDGTFEKKVVIATIQRGNKMVTYKVDKVTADDGTLYVAYTTTTKDGGTATYASPLIVSVDKDKYKSVVFIENGKKAGTADFPKEK